MNIVVKRMSLLQSVPFRIQYVGVELCRGSRAERANWEGRVLT